MSSSSSTIDKKTLFFALGLSSIVIFSVFQWVSPALGLCIAFVLNVIILLQIFGKTQRNIQRHQDNLFRQIECRENLQALMSTDRPLPYTRGYRGSPDFLLEIYQNIEALKPKVIVEASSGLSTLVCGYALKNIGDSDAKVFSLEHEKIYAQISQDTVNEHGLGSIASVIHAPLVEHTINNMTWTWYDYQSVDLPEKIDMIIVDGPPKRTQKNARYPALPLLMNRLAKGGILLLDDADRPSEKRAVELWLNDFPEISVEKRPLEKGMVFIKK